MDIIKILQEISPIIVAVCTITITVFAIMAYKKINPNQDRINKIRALSELRNYYDETELPKLIREIMDTHYSKYRDAYIVYKKAKYAGVHNDLKEETKVIINNPKYRDFWRMLWRILVKIQEFKLFINEFGFFNKEYVFIYRHEILILSGIMDDEIIKFLKTEERGCDLYLSGFDYLIDSYCHLLKPAKENIDNLLSYTSREQ